MRFRTILLFVVTSLVSTPSLLAMDFSPKDDEDFARIKAEILDIVENPSRAAEEAYQGFSSLPDYGWEHGFLPRLRTFGVMASLFEIEKAQYYASAGRWEPPSLPWIHPIMKFYQNSLNPKHAPYSWGVLQDPFYRFSKEFLVHVIERAPHGKALKLFTVLMQGQSDYWKNMMRFYVVPHEATTVADLDLLLGVDSELRTDWVRSFLDERPLEEVEALLTSYFARTLIEGKLARSIEFTHGMQLTYAADPEKRRCAEVLERVRGNFSEK